MIIQVMNFRQLGLKTKIGLLVVFGVVTIYQVSQLNNFSFIYILSHLFIINKTDAWSANINTHIPTLTKSALNRLTVIVNSFVI